MQCVLQLNIVATNDGWLAWCLLFDLFCWLFQWRLHLFGSKRQSDWGTSCRVGPAAKWLASAHGTHVAYHTKEKPMDDCLRKDLGPSVSTSVGNERLWLQHKSIAPQSRKLRLETSKTTARSSIQLHAGIWATVGMHLVVICQSSHPTTTNNLL